MTFCKRFKIKKFNKNKKLMNLYDIKTENIIYKQYSVSLKKFKYLISIKTLNIKQWMNFYEKLIKF